MADKRYLILALMAFASAVVSAGEVMPGKTYVYQMRSSDDKYYCIDIKGGKGKPGTAVQAYSCHGPNPAHLNQRWEYNRLHEQIGEGGVCLDSYDQGGGEGGRLTVQRCNGTQFQKWTFDVPSAQREPSEPQLTIKNTKGLCIGVQDGKLKDGTPLVMTDCRRKTWVTWRQVRTLSIHSVDCAKRIRQLNEKYLKDIGIPSLETERLCDDHDNDVYKTFDVYLERALHDKRNRIIQGVKRDLNNP